MKKCENDYSSLYGKGTIRTIHFYSINSPAISLKGTNTKFNMDRKHIQLHLAYLHSETRY